MTLSCNRHCRLLLLPYSDPCRESAYVAEAQIKSQAAMIIVATCTTTSLSVVPVVEALPCCVAVAIAAEAE